ncbi:tetratricopeptide repeat protein [Sphingobacterium spiritivorum]|uniref:tetratricopeptide repeat protein n=1 Tax=Sphingobacterium spiritivorum TaxID=258 RepID=UPI003DA55C08
MSNLIRIIISCLLLVGTVVLFWFGQWGWGVLGILITILAWVTVFFNENMLLAQWFMRKEKMDKAEQWLNRITNYEKQLIPAQHGYYNMLIGLIESHRAPLQSEKFFKKALSLGLHMDHNVALAKLSLAGIAMAKRNKREAEKYLQEAKKADKNKLLTEQIKMMKDQMGMMDRQQIRYSR